MATGRDSLNIKYQLLAFVGNGESGVSDVQFIKAAWILYEWMRSEATPNILLPQMPSTVSDSAKAVSPPLQSTSQSSPSLPCATPGLPNGEPSEM